MQLVAYGAQDSFLSGNPQITFFKLLYRRHTMFSIEAIQQTFQGAGGLGSRVQAIISRNGDLLHKLYVECDIGIAPTSHAYVSKLGHALIKSAEVELGGQRIDKVYGRWMDVWHGLTCPAEKEDGYEQMAGVALKPPSDQGFNPPATSTQTATTIYVPLNFFFSKGSCGAALPLIALQYHEVRITIEFGDVKDILRSSGDGPITGVKPSVTSIAAPTDGVTPPHFDAKLYADFIYLDTEERRRFAQTSHEYLIEQLQFTGEESITGGAPSAYRLNFNHPCKCFVWHLEKDGNNLMDPFWSGSDTLTKDEEGTKLLDSLNPVETVKLQLNGHERFSVRKGSFFSCVQPYQHFTRIPQMKWDGVYSFAISPEEHQPSGALNMSRIDTGRLVLQVAGSNTDTYKLFVYAVNYNVLRILSGMGGLAFSN
jgi:hypothetical protein